MKLNILERIVLGSLLPSEGNIVTLRVVRELQTQLSFTASELKEYQIESNPANGNIHWNLKGSKAIKEIKIPDTLNEAITKKLKELNEQKKLNPNLISLWEKFVEVKK